MMSVMYRLSMFNSEDLDTHLLNIDHAQFLHDANQFAEIRHVIYGMLTTATCSDYKTVISLYSCT